MKSFPISNKCARGFALVVTVSLMVLLAVMCVGLLGLSAVSLRSSTQTQAQAEAQANARLALMIAIGELQKQLGPDQRVSANSAILEGRGSSADKIPNPNWTGVWNSWQAGPADPDNPTPSAPSAHQTIPDSRSVPNGMSPTYTAGRADHFRSWLLSLNPGEASNIASPLAAALDGANMPGNNATAVRLVGEGTLGTSGQGTDARDYVSARLLPVASRASSAFRGRYGWWVGDESQKARLMGDSYETDPANSLAGRLARQQAPGSTGTRSIKGLEKITKEQQLAGLPSLMTVSLIEGATEEAQRNFHHVTAFSRQVLADVREGGLKRDLTTLLERPVLDDRSGKPMETSDEFMLYRFDTDGQERVPIQDLAAYYQLYDGARFGWKDGVRYSSNLISNGIQIRAPDFGNNQSTEKFLRGYTTLYRRPVPVKVQFLLNMGAETIEPPPVPSRNNPDPDTHRLVLGITPSVTLWNPTNLPLVMNFGDPYYNAMMLRLSNVPFFIQWNKNNGRFISGPVNMTWAAQSGSASGGAGGKSNIFSLYFSGLNQIRFEPGEVKVFSLPHRPGVFNFGKTDNFNPNHEVASGWDPAAFLLLRNSAPSINATDANHVSNNRLTFKASDSISFTVSPETANGIEALSSGNELPGSGLQFFMIQTSHQNRSGTGGLWHFRDYQFLSRYGSGTSTVNFNASLITKGFPNGARLLTSAARSGSSIIQASRNQEAWPFLQFALMAGTETGESTNGGSFGGRKFASRPFLHSTAIVPAFIDRDDGNSLYNYGWNWWVQDVNSVFEANIQVSAKNNGYYGGGYTPESGTTHVVQQEVPVVPPMSIAALSHAHLGGFSLSADAPCGIGSGIDNESSGYLGLVQVSNDRWKSFQKVTATGHGGLFPLTLQAIGNSYAHPNIPADKAYTTISRQYNMDIPAKNRTFADHSYLANKALWDEFFFSSISPVPFAVKAYDGAKKTTKEVAFDFFFKDDPVPLPNRRIRPYTRNLDRAGLDELLTKSSVFSDGLADRIAAHLMVEGPFNINSTSVEAWKTLLSSLKGKPVAYLDKGKALQGVINTDQTTPEGTPVASFSLPNGAPAKGSNDPQDPGQWLGWRELNDNEIDELAKAIVQQVKQRGPFLSLSEFVNRRLDSAKPDLSVKGALQAALDDPAVSINAGFRNKTRQFGSDANAMNPAFREALGGPVAYGSAAYVDQADVLRNFAAQLTPRGDTFLIRTYGDALDSSGNVVARAWCEAVVQRVPDYFDPADQAHVRQAGLKSKANKAFGRKLEIVNFRWMNPDEV